MTTTIKWATLCIMCAAIALVLYINIDSNWAADNGMGIVVTIGFFLAATAAILCGFNAVDSSGHATGK